MYSDTRYLLKCLECGNYFSLSIGNKNAKIINFMCYVNKYNLPK